MLGDPQAAEDVAQEAFIRVWRHAQVFDPRRGSAATWVLSITRNLAIDALRLRRSTPMDPARFLSLAAMSLDKLPEEAAETLGTGAHHRDRRWLGCLSSNAGRSCSPSPTA